jgi:hypothetical protein
MSDQTNLLGLPYIMPSQAQKHVTHNEALRLLDATIQLSVVSRGLTAPPEMPAEGDRYIVSGGAEGTWSGKDGLVAAFQDGAWTVLTPQEGWLAWVADEHKLVCRTGGIWAALEESFSQFQNLSLLGIGTTADAANPFAAKVSKALWSAPYAADGGSGDMRFTMNKESAANTVSLLMQDGWAGRAEIGLCGDDDLSLKVSPDGADWATAMRVETATGRPCFPQGLVHSTGAAVAQYIPTDPGSVFRLDVSRPATPRTFALSGVSGTTLTLSSASAGQIFGTAMRGLAAVRIWNTSKAPAEAAWVDYDLSADSLRVTDAAHVAGWSTGDALRLGDPNPTGANALQMVAIDISGFLQNALGAVFPQKGVMLLIYVSSSDGPAAQSYSGTGAAGTALGQNALGDGMGNQISVPVTTPTPSPISNSNLLFVRESLAATATDLTAAFCRVLGVYA